MSHDRETDANDGLPETVRHILGEEDDSLADIDPDIILISDYLAHEMTEAEAAAVEKRLEEDRAFFDKVWPLVQAWDLPVRFEARGDDAEGDG